MKRTLTVLLVMLLAGCGAKGSGGPEGPAGPGGATEQPEPTPSSGPPTAANGGPVDICAITDVGLVSAAGINAKTSYQSETAGYVPSDTCPVFNEATRVSVGDVGVSILPVTANEFGGIRGTLGGQPVAGLGDEAFKAKNALYARRGDVVVSVVRTSLPDDVVSGLISAALAKVPTPYPFRPRSAPKVCDRVDPKAVGAVLGAEVRAVRGRESAEIAQTSCKFIAGPGWIEVYFRHKPRTQPTDKLQRVEGIHAEAYVSPNAKQAYAFNGDREVYVVVWPPDSDRAGFLAGPFASVGPELGALLQNIADAAAP